MTFADTVLQFYSTLRVSEKLPRGVEVLNPYAQPETFTLCQQFYHKYYNDNNERTLILGINPGRFGAGLTGIPFMDPLKLEMICGIKNDFPKKAELSADFINMMITAYGGHEKFYSRFFINSVSPLGFVQDGKNLNYYDTPQLKKGLEKFILSSLHTQFNFGINQNVAYCLGEGENFKYITKLNNDEKFFKQVIPLAHPRFIMQYRRRFMATYIDEYLKKLNASF